MASETLKYFIEAVWKGTGATAQAKKDIEGVGTAGEKGAKGTDSLKSSLGALATAGALAIVAKQAYDFGTASVAAFSDAEEAYGKFDVVFGEFARATEADLDTIAEATGRSKYELIDYASTIQDTFVPLGFAREEAAKMSTSITELAIDLASFNNLETADVVRDLQSALVGNTETLRKYGVVAQETQIKAEALSLGLWDGTGAIDAQAKASAILSLAYKGTTDAQGDAIRTSDSLANKQRALEAATLDLKVAVGQGLAPAVTELTGDLIPMVNYLSDGINVAQKLDKAFEDGLVTDKEYAAGKLRLGVGLQLTSEQMSHLTKVTREHEQGMTDAEATLVRYYQGMGELAIQAEEAARSTTNYTGETLYATQAQEAALESTREYRIEQVALADAQEQAAIAAASQSESFGILTSTAGATNDAIATLYSEETTNAWNASTQIAQANADIITSLKEVSLATIESKVTSAVAAGEITAAAGNAYLIGVGEGLGLLSEDEANAQLAVGNASLQMAEELETSLAYVKEHGEATARLVGETSGEVAGSIAETWLETEDQATDAQTKVSELDSQLSRMAENPYTIEIVTVYSTQGSPPSTGGGYTNSSGGDAAIPEFATGGMVPGPVGSPQLILAHGGEQVLTQEQQRGRGGVTQNFYSNTREAQALAWAQAERYRRERMDAI